MSENIRPLYDRVIVKRLNEEVKTSGGIIIPETAKEKPQRGKVVSAGKGKRGEDGSLVPLEVKPGDQVLFGKYSGTEFKMGEDEYLMMKEDDIYGIIN